MWRRSYLLLLILRIYFALSPSYLHPDEVFQGPEVIAGELFGYQSVRTWEWTVANPIRSVFPLWPVYGLPMALLKALWSREGDGLVSPTTIYYTTRIVMFAMCFVLEDWAIHELVHSQRKFKNAVMLVASSYVTWTFQTHTFSNSIETLLVLWCLVLMQRIGEHPPSIDEKPGIKTAGPQSLRVTSGLALGFLLVLGIFNRITFPAFLLIPGMQLLPQLLNRPIALIAILFSATFWLFVAIATDTAFYHGPLASTSFRALFQAIHKSPVITPFNNLMYNSKASNLKQHGLHPHYQHILINLPQLLGPALPLLFTYQNIRANRRLTSALTGITILSVIPHQEPRFLLPAIPLILSCIRLPGGKWRKWFWVVWTGFNAVMGVLMGTFHQAGVVPAQLGMPATIRHSLSETGSAATNVYVYWWKTYPPSLYMLGPPTTHPTSHHQLTITTNPLLGANMSHLTRSLSEHVAECEQGFLDRIHGIVSMDQGNHVLLAAPLSAWRGDLGGRANFTVSSDDVGLSLTQIETYRRHLNLDDMDFAGDGVWDTLSRVVGRSGLGVWRVERDCSGRAGRA